MSTGLGFFYSVLQQKQPVSFMQVFNLTADDFTSEEQVILNSIQQHILIYGCLPSTPTVEIECDFRFPDFPDEPPEYWSDALVQRSLNVKIKEDVRRVQDALLNDGTEKAITLLRDAYIKANFRRKDKVIVELADLSRDVMEEHEKCRHGINHFSIPTGFEFLDEQTNGFQRGDFISIVARVSMGKTYVLLQMALKAHEAGKSVLLVSTEMSPIQYARRLLALKYGISINRIRLGQLSTNLGERVLENGIKELEQSPIPFKVMKSTLTTTMEDVIIQAKEMRPDFMCVDGAYLLKASNTKNQNRFEIVSNSAETLKALAQEIDRPILATYQMKRKTVGGLDDIYMSDSIAQISSIVLSLKAVDPGLLDIQDGELTRNYRVLELLKGREGETGKILINYNMERMIISQAKVLEDEDERTNSN